MRGFPARSVSSMGPSEARDEKYGASPTAMRDSLGP